MESQINITAVIETPKGSGHKYNFDPASGYFKLSKVMPAGMVFPFDFGYIPGTTGEDGDPIDVLIISELQTFTGCVADCKIIGGIKASQQERDGERMRNDRIIAIPIVSVQYSSVKKLSELPDSVMDQLENFFKNYNEQAGKVFNPLQRLSPGQAQAIVKSAHDLAVKDNLVQLFIPLKNKAGNPFPKQLFQKLNEELKRQYGGLTIYSRSPAVGIWEQDEETICDELIVYEVLTDMNHESYWKELKAKLEKSFDQDEILIYRSKIRKV